MQDNNVLFHNIGLSSVHAHVFNSFKTATKKKKDGLKVSECVTLNVLIAKNLKICCTARRKTNCMSLSSCNRDKNNDVEVLSHPSNNTSHCGPASLPASLALHLCVLPTLSTNHSWIFSSGATLQRFPLCAEG